MRPLPEIYVVAFLLLCEWGALGWYATIRAVLP